MDKLNLASEILINEINKKKEELHLTNAQLAEKAVSSSTNIPAKMLVSQEDKFLELFIENHQKQIADKNEQIKAKDRWIKTLVTIIILYACIFAVVTLLALAHHDINLLKSTAQIFYSLPL